MLERFTNEGRRLTTLAQDQALARGDDHVGTEHLILALISEGDEVSVQALQGLGIQPDQLRDQIEAAADRIYGPRNDPVRTGSGPGLPHTPNLNIVLKLAPTEARESGQRRVGPAHLLLAVLAHDEGLAADVLADNGVTLTRFRDQLVELSSAPQDGPDEQPDRRADANLGAVIDRLDRIEQTLNRMVRALESIERRSG